MTQEDRISSLEKSVALLEKRFNGADIQSINHTTTMLLGLAYKQQSETNDIKADFSAMKQRLDGVEQDIKELRVKSDEHTMMLTENTRLLTQMLALMTAPAKG
ncbi:hypothetical protein [Dictyobacter halimunensis]|uniref:hypothetical protein n=1 Tax=Dictyobacter halimunensis TaxID=3026934 RepID=UPI0030C6C342